MFLRLHGAAHGRFEVRADLPAELQVGVFAPGAVHRAWVRFSSDLQPGRPDLGGTLGVGIKLFDVDGPKLLEPDEEARTHDFILQNHPVFFVDDAAKMCAFTCASLNGQLDQWLADNKETAQILKDMEKQVDSALATPIGACCRTASARRTSSTSWCPRPPGTARPPHSTTRPIYVPTSTAAWPPARPASGSMCN
ncbi:hypothetical protein [Nannocystis pusilla]|uniref:hypothetical protein n=1 Tax=Nannocystis pusilla TaxID=889268 RepID=UPI003B8218E9